MPTLSTLVVFALAGLTLLAIPGPNHIYIVTRSAAQGRAAGYASALGVELATLMHVGAATVGLSALVASSPTAFAVVRDAGAVYLILLGVRALLPQQHVTSDAEAVSRSPTSHGRLLRDGMLVNLLNPKVVLFFLAFLPQFVDPDRGSVAAQTLVLGLLLAALGLATDLLYATIAAAVTGRLRRRAQPAGAAAASASSRLRWLTGGVYVSLGVAAATLGGRH